MFGLFSWTAVATFLTLR